VRAVKELVESSVALSAEADAIVAGALAQVPPNVKLQAVGTCVQAQADQMLAHAGASLGPVGGLMETAQGLLDLVPGMPGLPSVEDMTGKSAQEMLDALDVLIAVLDALQIPGGG